MMKWLPNRSVLERLAKQLAALGLAIVLIGFVGILLDDDGTPAAAPATSPTAATISATTSTTRPTATTSDAPIDSVSVLPTTSTQTTPSPTTTSPTTTISPTTTTTTTAAPRESIEDFVVRFALAIASGDVEFLLDRLHPAVLGGFGPDLCRNWIETEILQLGNYQLTGPVEGPRDQSFTTPAGTGTIEGAYSAPVSFIFEGQLFNAEGGFALIGTEVHWLGQCR